VRAAGRVAAVLVASLAGLGPAAVAADPGPGPAVVPGGLAVTLRGVRVGAGGRLVATVALADPAAASRRLGAAAFRASVAGRPARVAAAEPLAAGGRRVAVVLAVDASASMRSGGNIDLAKAAADGFATELPPATDLGVVAFATRSRVAQPLTPKRRRVRTALAGLRAGGRTALHDAVVQAARLLAGRDGQRNLVLLSDGKDDGSRAPAWPRRWRPPTAPT